MLAGVSAPTGIGSSCWEVTAVLPGCSLGWNVSLRSSLHFPKKQRCHLNLDLVSCLLPWLLVSI